MVFLRGKETAMQKIEKVLAFTPFVCIYVSSNGRQVILKNIYYASMAYTFLPDNGDSV